MAYIGLPDAPLCQNFETLKGYSKLKDFIVTLETAIQKTFRTTIKISILGQNTSFKTTSRKKNYLFIYSGKQEILKT